MTVLNNLPCQPYKAFFGREDSLKRIKEILLDGNTFISSVDGIGGIGKTALTYYFCVSHIINSDRFKYLVWISTKNTVFDSFSTEKQIKDVCVNFKGINTLFDTTFSVIGCEDFILENEETKKDIFETEILSKEPIFFVLDNLENVEDAAFYNYITTTFNKFAVNNKNLKVLTTSRKRRRLADFPIEIEGLKLEDALKMLKNMALEYQIKDILTSNDHDNAELLKKVGCIPLGIEFIIGQMKSGKNRGQIYNELNGYPSIDDSMSDVEKRTRMSDIIVFSFKDMYESLSVLHQKVFKIIAALQKNKRFYTKDIDLDILLFIAKINRNDLISILDDLLDNKLISCLNNGYTINQMAINFVRQFYDDFGKVEDEILGNINEFVVGGNDSLDNVDKIINSIRKEVDRSNDYEKAENSLVKALDISQDYRVYYELAKIQRVLNKTSKAEDNFDKATTLNPSIPQIWYDWVNMTVSQGLFQKAYHIIKKALDCTNDDVSIFIQKMQILKYQKKYEEIRKEADLYIEKYSKDQRPNEHLRLLNSWKAIELTLAKQNIDNEYFRVVDLIFIADEDRERKLQMCYESKRLAINKNAPSRVKEYTNKICKLENEIQYAMPYRIKNLNRLLNEKAYEECKREANKILGHFSSSDKKNYDHYKNALRVLLQILSTEEDFEKIIVAYDMFIEIGEEDHGSKEIYNKARKEIKRVSDNKVIDEIEDLVKTIELKVRAIVLGSFNNSEDLLVNFVKEKGHLDWVERWIINRDKSLINLQLLHYSDFSELRQIFDWQREYFKHGVEDTYALKEQMKKILAYLQNIIKIRNEISHVRLVKNIEMEEGYLIQGYLIDCKRTISSLEEFIVYLNNK